MLIKMIKRKLEDRKLKLKSPKQKEELSFISSIIDLINEYEEL
jgi:hypothetical protein